MARPKGSKNKTAKAKPDKAPKTKAKPKGAAVAGAAEPTESVKGSEVTGMITKSVLASILSLDKKTKRQQSELAGDIGSAVAKAVERFGTNRKALGIIRTLNRMEPEKLADFLDHFDYMLDISGLEDRASAVQRLPIEGAKEGDAGEVGEGEGEGGEPAGDVSPPSAFTGPRLVAAGE